MTRDEEIWYERRRELLKMIREAGISTDSHPMNALQAYPEEFERFAELVAKAESRKVAAWMIRNNYATGHGDSVEDLLKELEWQVAERAIRARGDV